LAAALTPGAARALSVSAPGYLPSRLPATGRQFSRAFAAAYGHRPGPEAIFGYEAMSALLGTLREAGNNAGNRTTVLHDFFALRNRASVLGTYSLDTSGDTNLAPFVISRVTGGRLAPYRFVSAPG
jgi:branched-chain amino acid transport system substrate-binding protein